MRTTWQACEKVVGKMTSRGGMQQLTLGHGSECNVPCMKDVDKNESTILVRSCKWFSLWKTPAIWQTATNLWSISA
jgi:hypothetical protein